MAQFKCPAVAVRIAISDVSRGYDPVVGTVLVTGLSLVPGIV